MRRVRYSIVSLRLGLGECYVHTFLQMHTVCWSRDIRARSFVFCAVYRGKVLSETGSPFFCFRWSYLVDRTIKEVHSGKRYIPGCVLSRLTRNSWLFPPCHSLNTSCCLMYVDVPFEAYMTRMYTWHEWGSSPIHVLPAPFRPGPSRIQTHRVLLRIPSKPFRGSRGEESRKQRRLQHWPYRYAATQHCWDRR